MSILIIETMTYYCDTPTNVKYYDPVMVVEICQIESRKPGKPIVEDMRVFLVHDAEDDLICVYGSRKSENDNYVDFMKTFDSESHAYDFLNVMMGFDGGYRCNTSVHYMSNLTDYSMFDDFVQNVCKKSEISGYDNVKMSKKRFRKYMSVIF